MTSTTLPAAVEFGEHSLTIIDRDGTPWLAAADLARALGYKRADVIGHLYRKHADEFTDGMSGTIEMMGPNQNRPTVPVRVFSPRGCYAIAMFARTERAAAFRRWVLDVLEGLAQPARRQETALSTLIGQRWCVYFDDQQRPHFSQIPAGAIMVRPEEIAEVIADPASNIRRHQMPEIIRAAASRLLPYT